MSLTGRRAKSDRQTPINIKEVNPDQEKRTGSTESGKAEFNGRKDES
jgi:hypothetical protein